MAQSGHNKQPSSWRWFSRKPVPDLRESSLTFTDILFGLVLAEMFRRGNELAEISWAGRMHLAVALVLVAGSWIGYHNSRKRPNYQSNFFNLPLFLFVLDLTMVFLYWLLGINPEGTPELARGPDAYDPSALLEVNVVSLVFLLYLLWDFGTWCMARSGKYPDVHHDLKRTIPTVGGLLLSLGIAILVWCAQPSSIQSVVIIDAFLIVVLILYRYTKDGLQREGQALQTDEVMR